MRKAGCFQDAGTCRQFLRRGDSHDGFHELRIIAKARLQKKTIGTYRSSSQSGLSPSRACNLYAGTRQAALELGASVDRDGRAGVAAWGSSGYW